MHSTLSQLSIENPLWHRVAHLRPHLRSHVRVQRRRSGEETWYLLIDPDTGRFHRLNRAAWEWAGRLDGRHDVDTLWRHVHERLGEGAPTQADVMRLLAQLSDADLVTVDALPELDLLLRHKRRVEQRRKLAVANPLSFKVPLFDPTAALDRLLPMARWIFTGWGLLAWLLLVLAAGATALSHAGALQHALATHAGSTAFLLVLWAAYPFVKLLHEFGHALAVRVWGGEVREIGVNLMLLTPVPYVDASAATQFAQRHRRMLVGAAGIMVELAIAALALFAWLAATVPWLQLLALAVMTMCAVSTLLFNGNPLARFDGYYVLSDALEVPNLAARANEVVARWARGLAGARELRPAADTGAVRAGLALYAISAFAYRWAVGLAIVVWLHGTHPLLAALAVLLLGFSLVLQPAWRLLRFTLQDSRLLHRRRRAAMRAGSVAAAAVLLLGVLPAPSLTTQEGVVWLSDRGIVRSETDGLLLRLHAQAGAAVREGEPIATLENFELAGERETAATRRAQLNVEYFRALAEDPALARRIDAQRTAMDVQIERLDQRLDGLVVRAQAAGTLVLPRDRSQEGHFFPQGRELGYVMTGEPMLVKVALTEAQAARVREDTRTVRIRLAHASGIELEGRVERHTPAATQLLPTPALGSAHGGPIATDPADPQGRRTLQPVTLVDVRVPAQAAQHMGMRAWVRFEHAGEPLAHQAWRRLRQLFLRSLGAGQ